MNTKKATLALDYVENFHPSVTFETKPKGLLRSGNPGEHWNTPHFRHSAKVMDSSRDKRRSQYFSSFSKIERVGT